MRTEDALVSRGGAGGGPKEDWVDSVADTAAAMKKFFTRTTCRLCQVYVDEQVQYEVQQEQKPNSQSWITPISNFEVELYRQFLFDEDSVVEQVSERDGSNDEDDSGEPSRTEALVSVVNNNNNNGDGVSVCSETTILTTQRTQ